jgi:hypothetical protein
MTAHGVNRQAGRKHRRRANWPKPELFQSGDIRGTGEGKHSEGPVQFIRLPARLRTRSKYAPHVGKKQEGKQ